MKMRASFLVTFASLGLASCADDDDGTAAEVWVKAAAMPPPTVAYSPKPIVTAREREDGMWVWHMEKAAPETLPEQQLLAKIAGAAALRPEPLILFSFSRRADDAALAALKARIAEAAGCSTSRPCIEGTPEQLP